MNFKVFHINAFVTESFLGNPACVIPLKSWPSSSKMLAVAKKNNVSRNVIFNLFSFNCLMIKVFV